jgi:hypothetical protein
MSVRLHYPEVFDGLSVMDLENLDDQTEGFIDFKQRIDWMFRMVGYEGKRQTAKGLTQAW